MNLFGIPFEFFLFGLTLLGVVLLHNHTLAVALTGMFSIAGFKLLFGNFKGVTGAAGLGAHLAHEWVILANLLCILLGFALLAKHFEHSKVPDILPRYLPDDWKGGLVLLILIFVLSGFLDNIAAAMIGGTVAMAVFKGRVHIGYLAAIVAASNAGGAGSVVGDTTTTMMWIAGVKPIQVLEAYVGAIVALAFFGVVAAKQQHAYQAISKDEVAGVKIDWARIAIVAITLTVAVSVNIFCNKYFPAMMEKLPVLGGAVFLTMVVLAVWRQPDWKELPPAFKGSVFLLALVMCASMMPVESLPKPSWQTAFGLGFLSSVFDNIPLTALAIRQDGYDWGFLAYAVGFGGSMLWFGSTAGVALTNMFPQGKSAIAWLKGGWHVVVGYILGYAALMLVIGFTPQPIVK